MTNVRSHSAGFTLIELLTVVAIIGLLASTAMSSFSFYKQNAAFSVVRRLGDDVRQNLEVSASNPDESPPAFNIFSSPQNATGPLQDTNAKKVLSAVQLPSQVTLAARFDPNCSSAGCESAFIEMHHSRSKKYLQLFRAGDGIWAPIEQTS